jgi:hypothetical protein
LEVVIGHLGHEFGTERFPGQVLSGTPPALPPRLAMIGITVGHPRMVVPGVEPPWRE